MNGVEPSDPAPGGTLVGTVGVVVSAAILVVAAAGLGYLVVKLWPEGAEAESETHLLALVVTLGALGGMMHSIRSFAWYVANRELRWSWLAFYALRPLAAAGLALIVYVVVRGGLLPANQIDGANANPFGFAALGVLTGMFSEQAVEKLREVAATVLTAAPQGRDGIEPYHRPSGT